MNAMTYTFEDFLKRLDTNWYDDDAVLQRLLRHFTGPDVTDELASLGDLGDLCSGTLRGLAERSALLENRPVLRQFDAYNRRVDEILLPPSTLRALQIVEGQHRLGALHGDPQLFYAKWYLVNQNGEAGVGCSLACTDGMVRALEYLGDQPIHRDVVREVHESTPARYVHGAQFVTEIQGGSDVGTNTLEAHELSGRWTLHGQKWFCSNINADYFLVTGRPRGAPAGSQGVALFLVPAYRDEDRRFRNGFTIERLKEKLGTCELATAEVTFDGAKAYPVGPLDRGLPNLVTFVLVTSRIACASVAAASLRQAERLATAYAEFRTAFGKRLNEYPLVQETLREVRAARERSLAAVMELIHLWQATDFGGEHATAQELDFRILLSLCKPVLTQDATRILHDTIMVLGANGVEERFSSLPRLLRDAVIMETWEGPHNVLFTQALRDMMRYEIEPAAFVQRVTGDRHDDLVRELDAVLSKGKDPTATVTFAHWARRFVAAFGERVLQEAGGKEGSRE